MTEYSPASPNERWGLGGSSMTRQFDLINGSFLSRMQAAYDIYGYAVVVPNPSPPSSGSYGQYYIHRVTPMPYPARSGADIKPAAPGDLPLGTFPPDMTQRFWAIAGTRTEPLGQPAYIDLSAQPQNAANYTRARLTVEFSTLPYQIKSDSQVTGGPNGVPDEGYFLSTGWQNTRYIIRHIDPFSRLIKIPYGMAQTVAYTYPSGGSAQKPTKVGISYREGGAVVQYTWMRVPLATGPGSVSGLNFGRIADALGTINKYAFDQYAAKTLFFDNFGTREYQGYFGEPLVDAVFRFIFLPHPSTGNNYGGGTGGGPQAGTPTGWNTLFDIVQDANGVWQADYYPVSMSLSASNYQPPFQSSDFSQLMSP